MQIILISLKSPCKDLSHMISEQIKLKMCEEVVHKKFNKCRYGRMCKWLCMCGYWHSIDEISFKVNQYTDLLIEKPELISKMFYILDNPRICKDSRLMTCRNKRIKCSYVHTDQLDTPEEVNKFKHFLFYDLFEHINLSVDMFYETLEEEYNKSVEDIIYAKREFIWKLEHYNASSIGVILPDFMEELLYLQQAVRITYNTLRHQMVHNSLLITESYTYLMEIIVQKKRLTETSLTTANLIIHDEQKESVYLHELWLRTFVIKKFPIITKWETSCEICLSDDIYIDGLLIQNLPVCRSCIIDHLASLKSSQILDDIEAKPCITGFTKLPARLSLPLLIDTLMKLDLTGDQLRILIKLQGQLLLLSTQCSIERTRRETEIMCDAIDLRKRLITKLQKLMTLTCPNPLCERAFDDWNSCAALFCQPSTGQQITGFCGAHFCAVCGMSSREDIHQHVQECVNNVVKELVRIKAIPPVESELTYYIPLDLKPRVILYRKIKAIKLAVRDFTPEDRKWCLEEMGKLHPELLEPCFHFLD